jgi:hypothetical protein
MKCPNCGAQMQPGPIRGQKRCKYCDTIVDERPQAPKTAAAAGPFGLLADKDGDGTPDILQMASSVSHTQVQAIYEINGKRYESLEEVPAEYRSLIANATTVETAPEVVIEVGPEVTAQRVERTESHVSWPRHELERADFGGGESKPDWLKPFVLGLLAALLLGWLLFG